MLKLPQTGPIEPYVAVKCACAAIERAENAAERAVDAIERAVVPLNPMYVDHAHVPLNPIGMDQAQLIAASMLNAAACNGKYIATILV